MLCRSIDKQSVESVRNKKRKATVGRICRRGNGLSLSQDVRGGVVWTGSPFLTRVNGINIQE